MAPTPSDFVHVITIDVTFHFDCVDYKVLENDALHKQAIKDALHNFFYHNGVNYLQPTDFTDFEYADGRVNQLIFVNGTAVTRYETPHDTAAVSLTLSVIIEQLMELFVFESADDYYEETKEQLKFGIENRSIYRIIDKYVCVRACVCAWWWGGGR